jgi:hypothetical protein
MVSKFRHWVRRLFRAHEFARYRARLRPRGARPALEALEDRTLPAVNLMLSGLPSPAVAGVPGNVTVTALDGFGNTDPSYSGTVHFTSSDAQAVLPADATLTNGVGAFSATLDTAGSQTLTATDTADPTLTGAVTVTVTPAAAGIFTVTASPTALTAGTGTSIMVAAFDAFGNVAAGYTGTVHFTSSDPQASLPTDYTFTPAEAGVHVFSVTLNTAGSQSVTAADTVTNTVAGSQTGITVTPAATTTLLTESADVVAYGQPITFTATVQSVAPSSLIPTGAVVFRSGSAVLGTAALDATGVATFTTSALPPGKPSITATFGGDGNTVGSGSATLTPTVGTPDQRFIEQAYQKFLHRDADALGLAYWGARLDAGDTRAQVALGIEQSPEGHAALIQDLYHQFLHRDAEPAGLAYWEAALDSGATAQDVEAGILRSDEYMTNFGGGTQAGFVSAVYQDVLGRSVEPSAASYWDGVFASGATPAQVAQGILTSDEARTDLVQSSYQTFLGRAGDDGVGYWVSLLQQGARREDVLAGIAGSDEFFSRV